MTAAADDPTLTTDQEMRRTLREVRRVANLLMRGLEPDDAGPSLLDVLEAHLGVRPEGLPVTTEEIPGHRTVDADIAVE